MQETYLESMTTAFRVPFRIHRRCFSDKNIEWLANQRNDKNKNINTIYLPLNFTFSHFL